MATKKKKPSKRFLHKVHELTEKDLFKSIAIVSILLNILFFASFVVITSTSTFNRTIYTSVKKQYCKNIDGVKERAQQLGSEKAAINEWRVTCVSEDFAPYYKEAIEKFKAQQAE